MFLLRRVQAAGLSFSAVTAAAVLSLAALFVATRLLSLAGPVHAAPDGMAAMIIDMDPEDGAANGGTFTPVNNDSSFGTVQFCARIDNDNVLNQDEDVTADRLRFDILADDIPVSTAMLAFQAKVNHDDSNLTVVAPVSTASPGVNMISRDGNFNESSANQPLPDVTIDGSYGVSATDQATGEEEAGDGVLARIPIEADGADGVYSLVLDQVNSYHLDTNGVLGGLHMPNAFVDGTIAVGQSCPMPPVDIEIVSLSLTSLSGPTVPVGTDFTIQVSGTATSLGPNPADIRIDLDLAIPPDCTKLPVGGQSENFPAVPDTESRTATKDWTVNCSDPSNHQFDATGSVVVTGLADDTNLANNGPINTSDSVAVTANADAGISGLTVTAPATAPVGDPFSVTVSGTLHNAGPHTPAVVDITLDLVVPGGCARVPNGSQGDTGVSLALSTSTPVSKTWTVTCSSVGAQAFSGSASVAVNQAHVSDPNAGNDTAAAGGSTNVQGPADLKVTGVSVSAPATADSGTPFSVTVTATLHNNGPSSPVDGDATLDFQLPGDCSKAPNGSQTNTNISLDQSIAVQTSATWDVTCTTHSSHILTGDGSVTPSSPQISDPVAANNSGQGQATTGILATSDVKVTGVIVTAPSDAATGAPFTVTVTPTVHNNGPLSPLGVDVTNDLVLPAGCSKVPAGPQVTGVVLATSVPTVVPSSWTVTCVTQGLKTFTGTSDATITELHVSDSNLGNNTGQAQASTNTSLGAADVKVTSVAVTSPATAPVDTNFGVTVNTIVHNNGPYFPVNTDITVTLNLPPDCFTPVTTLTFFDASLGPSVAAMLPEVTFFVTCIDHSFHDFTATATIVVSDPLAGDPTPGNNTLVSTPSTTAILRTSDLKVVSATAAAPATAVTNVPFNVTVDATLHNNGTDPAPADVVVTLALPPDCTAPSNPRTVPVNLPVSIATPLPVQTFVVTCTTRSDHDFSATVNATAPLHVIDLDGGNNSAASAVATVGVFDQSDLKVTSVTTTSPAQAVVGTAFIVGTTTVIHNNGPYGPADSDVTVTLSLPPDCTATDPNPQVVTGMPVPVSVATPLNLTWSVTCTTESAHDFSASSSVVVNMFHVEDPAPGNNAGSSATSTTAVFAQADLKVTGVTVASPAQGIVGTPFIVSASTTVHNNGPFGPVNATVSTNLALPPDCSTADANPNVATGVSLPVSVPTTVNSAWTVTCTEKSSHVFTATGSVAVDQLHVADPDGGNNSAVSATSTTDVYAQADLKVTGTTLAGPAQGTVGVAFTVTATTTVHNNGPFGPADGDLSVSLNLPGDCSTADPNPGVTAVSLPVSVPTPVNSSWSVTCTSQSNHSFSATSTVSLDHFHVADPDGANDQGLPAGATVPVFAQADGKIVSSTVLVTPPPIVPANTNVLITIRKLLHNNGPFGPATFDLTKSATPPAGCTVTPPLPSSHTLAVSASTNVDEVWGVSCVAGTYTFTFVNLLTVTGLHIADPNATNNSGTVSVSLSFETDADGIPDAIEVACGSNPNNTASIPERIDGVYAGADDDLDTQVDEALPAGALNIDCDRDGFKGSAENYVYLPSTQGDQDPCGSNNTPPTDPPSPIGWPADLTGAGTSINRIDILDLTAFVTPTYYLFTTVGTNPGDRRWNLVEDSSVGAIDIVDLSNLVTLRPPMLNDVSAMLGPSCPWPP